MPIGLSVAGANRNDMKLVRETIESIPVERPLPTPEQPQGMCLDKGYDFQEVRDILAEFGFTAHIRARGEEAQQLKRDASKRARRWVVERAHSWMNRFRRILIRWDKKPIANWPGIARGYAARAKAHEKLGNKDQAAKDREEQQHYESKVELKDGAD